MMGIDTGVPETVTRVFRCVVVGVENIVEDEDVGFDELPPGASKIGVFVVVTERSLPKM
jgi:hypothetical protein